MLLVRPSRFLIAGVAGSFALLGCASVPAGESLPGTDGGEVLGRAFVVGCDRFTIGEESGPLVAAYGIDQFDIDEPCFGDRDPVVEQAWNELAEVTPVELIESVAIVAGFEPNESETLAFVAPINDDTEAFLIALDVETGAREPGELRVTMAHELAHVFTQTTDQLDVAVYRDECDTFFNGFGCFRAGSYLTDWVDEFWSPDELGSLPADGGIDETGGDERCSLDSAFPGSYAASHPEEDFAESFAAYVFDVDLPDSVDPRLAFFADDPTFVAMKAAVAEAGWAAPPSNFDQCG